ncbi:hypothetical protein Hanom_Chr10g00947271 [Helianthus anomalus]
MKLELGSARAYLFELELDSSKPKDRAWLDSARATLRTTSNKLRARLELASTSVKRAKVRFINVIIITIIIILYI